MTSTTLSKPKLDLRAPVLTQLRRGIGVRWLQVITLVLLDATILFLTWQIAENYGAPIDFPWNRSQNSLSVADYCYRDWHNCSTRAL